MFWIWHGHGKLKQIKYILYIYFCIILWTEALPKVNLKPSIVFQVRPPINPGSWGIKHNECNGAKVLHLFFCLILLIYTLLPHGLNKQIPQFVHLSYYIFWICICPAEGFADSVLSAVCLELISVCEWERCIVDISPISVSSILLSSLMTLGRLKLTDCVDASNYTLDQIRP